MYESNLNKPFPLVLRLLLRSTVKAADRKFIILCHLKTLRLYTGLFKFELDHYLTNVARVKIRIGVDRFYL